MPLVITSSGSEEIKLLKNSIPELKISPIIEAGSNEAMLKLVKDGNGIGYIQEEYIQDELTTGSLKKLNVNFMLPKLDLYCGYFTETLAFASKKFIECLISKN